MPSFILYSSQLLNSTPPLLFCEIFSMLHFPPATKQWQPNGMPRKTQTYKWLWQIHLLERNKILLHSQLLEKDGFQELIIVYFILSIGSFDTKFTVLEKFAEIDVRHLWTKYRVLIKYVGPDKGWRYDG